MTTIHPPFPVTLGDKSELIANPFSGESIMLDPVAVAVYDVIKGAELLGDSEIVRKGLDWFIQYYPEAYMTLLD
jgi:hypothetical protein